MAIQWVKEPERQSKVYSQRLGIAEAQKVDKIAAENGISVSSVIRKIVEYYFENIEK